MLIALDFDGTCVSHEFPFIGKDIGARKVLRQLIRNKHQLILNTMRCDSVNGKYLTEAINWFTSNGINLYSIYRDPNQKNWTTSPKCFADLIIDDTSLGIPLKIDKSISDRPFVDWVLTEELLRSLQYIK